MISFTLRTSAAERTNDKRHHVHAMLQPKLKIGAVFGGKRGNRERRARQVDALMLGQHIRH